METIFTLAFINKYFARRKFSHRLQFMADHSLVDNHIVKKSL